MLPLPFLLLLVFLLLLFPLLPFLLAAVGGGGGGGGAVRVGRGGVLKQLLQLQDPVEEKRIKM